MTEPDTTLRATCENCEWRSDGPRPYAEAIAHHRETKHITTVDTTAADAPQRSD